MILVIDVGNTNIVLGVYQDKDLIKHWRVTTDREKTMDEYAMLLHNLFQYDGIDFKDIGALVVSSVVPPVVPVLERLAVNYFNRQALVVGPGVKTGIAVKSDNPREVGADRIVNAVAGYELYGGPLVIVDFGTATTFDVISARGEYLGGAIAPGIGISTEALYTHAAKLPRIELVKPKSVIGKNTVHSMQAGIIYGFVGQVDEIVRRIKEEMQDDPMVLATGGLAELIAEESTTINRVNSLLTLEGLRIIYERNHG